MHFFLACFKIDEENVIHMREIIFEKTDLWDVIHGAHVCTDKYHDNGDTHTTDILEIILFLCVISSYIIYYFTFYIP